MSEARRLATGSLAQQAAQVAGLLAMFVILTVLARRLSPAELGIYGLLNALAGYLLIVQNSSAGAAVRGMAAASDRDEGSTAFTTAALIYLAAGALAAVALALLGVLLAATLDLSDELARDVRLGGLAAGVATLAGWPVTVYRDALRARSRLVLAARAELVGVGLYATLVLALAFADAPLWLLIGASASISLTAGLACMVAALSSGLPWRLRPRSASRTAARDFLGLAGLISLSEASSAAVYVIARTALGLFRSPSAVGLLEGPIRIHNLVRALNGAATVSVLPTATRLSERGDSRRLGDLLVRGYRYALAGIVPVAVVSMTLAGPILDAWLGEPFGEGAAALAILMSHWLLNAIAGVAAGVLIATDRTRDLARWAVAVAIGSVLLALALIEPLGVEGAAIAMAAPYVLAFPYLVASATKAAAVPVGRLAREAFVPAWALAAVLAAALVAVRALAEPDGPLAVLAVAGVGLAGYWLAYYALLLDAGERRLIADLLPGRRRQA
jgi:O-antigen/teichoic acid export membrane protein